MTAAALRLLGAILIASFALSGARAANAPPVADAGPDRVVLAGETVILDGTASADPDGGVLSHRWSLGDGREATGAVVRHRYRAAGTYVVRLTVRDGGAPAAEATDSLTVTVRPPPNTPPLAVARAPATATAGVPVDLDASESRDADGVILAFRWHVGGAVRNAPRIAHVFHAPGLHLVRLEVEDDRGVTAETWAAVAVVPAPDPPPVADAGPDRVAVPGVPVAFDAGRSRDPGGAILAWRWSFGDGATAKGPLASHAYAKPGRYRVRLEVKDATRRASDEATVVVNAPPVAEAGPDRRSRGSVHVFDGSASFDPDGRVIRFHWDFGDGQTAEGPRVAHDFGPPGRYPVTLTVTDDSGLSNATATDRLEVVVEPPPVAEAGPPRFAAPGVPVVFDAGRAASAGIRAVWQFGDGTRAVGRVVEKAFDRPGRHVVRLSLHAVEGGPPLATDEASVTVNAQPVARAGPDIRTAPGEEVRLDASGSHDPDGEIRRYVWRIGDEERRSPVPVLSRRFDTPGRHIVHLSVIDDSGAPNETATDTLVVSVNAPPVASAGPDRVVADREVIFDAGASFDPDGDPVTYRWTFGDGNAGEGVRTGHVYAAPGRYAVTLEVDDGTGFANAVARDEAVVRVNAAPLAEAGPNILACAGNVVNFDGGESVDPDGGALSHLWTFDDGLVLEGMEVRRTFEEAGAFAATLAVNDGSGVANASARDRVFVSIDPRPRAEAGPDRRVCVGEAVVFDGTASSDLDGAVNRFRWSFGDGASAEGARPSHAYAAPGRYRVSLTVEGDPLPRCDATDIDWATVDVSPAPSAAIDAPGAAATGEPVTFSGRVELPEGADVLAWNWDFGDGATARGATVAHRYETPGRRLVRLSVTTGGTQNGCATATATHGIAVNRPPEPVLAVPDVVTVHRPVRLDASGSRDPDGVLIAYRLAVSDGSRLAGVAPEHIFARPGRHEITLEVEDDSGQANAVARTTRTVEVIAPPDVEIVGHGSSCVGEPVLLRAALPGGSYPPPGARVFWELGDGAVSELIEVTHVYRSPGARTVTANLEAVVEGAAVSRQVSATHRVNASPVAVAGVDVLTCPGFAVDFDGRRSFDPDGDALRPAWTFGDGAAAEGLVASHRYAVPGLYRAALRVDDGAGTRCSAATDTVVVRVNAPPTADGGGDRRVALTGGVAEVTLDASGSRDPEGRVLRHIWSLDGFAAVEGQSSTFRFTSPGRHVARLEVSDGTGLPCGVAGDTVMIEVLP